MPPHHIWLLPLLALGVSCSLAFDSFPAGTCSVEGQACEIHEENLVASLPGVSSVEECRQLCSDDLHCSHFSHFGLASFPIGNFCILLYGCPSLHPCEDCITEDRWCSTTCGDDVEGFLGENVVELLADVTEELDCKKECNNNTDCKFYTYHNGSDPNYPQLCFLLTHLEEPFKACSHCSTGTASCVVDTVCGFLTGSQVSEALIFTDTEATHEVETIAVGVCEANILAIGGGGRGGAGNSGGTNYGGGGGSGHVILTSHVLRKSSNLLLNVGARSEPSSVTTEDGSSVILAPAGEDGWDGSRDGANGYSGGGGDGISSGSAVGSGGSDGSDGEAGASGQGGKGSGLDISSFALTNFVLTPGSGGSRSCGGGGGGVLINGKAPGHNSGMGEGYGGGGEGCNKNSRYGSPGAILMEIKK